MTDHTEHEGLVKRLRESRNFCESIDMRSIADLLADAIAAISAQPQGEPVATTQEDNKSLRQVIDLLREALTKKELDRQYHMNAINRLASFLAFHATSEEVITAAIQNITRLAAQPSGVREGMLRAAEICKGILVECIKNKKERGDHAVIAMCREAITRAADQVNAEGGNNGKV